LALVAFMPHQIQFPSPCEYTLFLRCHTLFLSGQHKNQPISSALPQIFNKIVPRIHFTYGHFTPERIHPTLHFLLKVPNLDQRTLQSLVIPFYAFPPRTTNSPTKG